MKAVNLIPEDERRGAGGAAGRSGGGAYVLIAALVVLVAMVAAYASSSKSVKDQEAKLATTERDASASELKVSQLAGYTSFAALRVARVATVTSIAQSRFDWAHALHEVGRTLPANITLTTLTGSVAAGAGGGTVSLRSTYNVPALELVGCAPDQSAIPPMMASLRQVDGVRRVALQQSIKGTSAAATAGTSAGGKAARVADCSRNFEAVMFFDPKVAPSLGAAAPPVATPGAAVTPVPAAGAPGTTQPVSGGTK